MDTVMIKLAVNCLSFLFLDHVIERVVLTEIRVFLDPGLSGIAPWSLGTKYMGK